MIGTDTPDRKQDLPGTRSHRRPRLTAVGGLADDAPRADSVARVGIGEPDCVQAVGRARRLSRPRRAAVRGLQDCAAVAHQHAGCGAREPGTIELNRRARGLRLPVDSVGCVLDLATIADNPAIARIAEADPAPVGDSGLLRLPGSPRIGGSHDRAVGADYPSVVGVNERRRIVRGCVAEHGREPEVPAVARVERDPKIADGLDVVRIYHLDVAKRIGAQVVHRLVEPRRAAVAGVSHLTVGSDSHCVAGIQTADARQIDGTRRPKPSDGSPRDAAVRCLEGRPVRQARVADHVADNAARRKRNRRESRDRRRNDRRPGCTAIGGLQDDARPTNRPSCGGRHHLDAGQSDRGSSRSTLPRRAAIRREDDG